MIEGNWSMERGEQDGQEIPQDEVGKSKLLIQGDKHHVTWAAAELQGTHRLDTDASPMTIDAMDAAGPFEGMSLKGIFKLENDLLTVCFAAPGEERPKEFSTKDGGASFLHVWQRSS